MKLEIEKDFLSSGVKFANEVGTIPQVGLKADLHPVQFFSDGIKKDFRAFPVLNVQGKNHVGIFSFRHKD